MLNSATYKDKYIELLKKETPDNNTLNGPVVERYGAPKFDQHICTRLNKGENDFFDVILPRWAT